MRLAITRIARPLITLAGFVLAWEAIARLTGAPAYILPRPGDVAEELFVNWRLIGGHALYTIGEVLAGMTLGCALGMVNALQLVSFALARRWLLPLLVFTQAVPVFALAPVITLWLGYGLASKIAITTLMIYFPITAAFYDGLRRTDPGWLELARVMGADKRRTLMLLRIPAALPALGSGLRMAAAFAPIGAVIGEWVGASNGLGYLMLYANGRVKIDLMFAALIVLAVFALTFHAAISHLVRRCTRWSPDTTL